MDGLQAFPVADQSCFLDCLKLIHIVPVILKAV